MASPSATSETRLSCWPNHLETLLLRAGLCELKKALPAWREFCDEINDIETLDDGCYRLFPLVAGNLQASQEEIPHRARIMGVLRHTWVKNQRLLGEITPLLRALQNQGIELLLLKGAALMDLYRQRGGVRSMADVDILIHPDDLPRAVTLLEEMDCSIPGSPGPERLSDLLRFRHELTITTDRNFTLDIHWYLVSDARHLEAEDYFWRDAVPCSLPGLCSHTLQPSDQFLHTCLHGVQWNEVSPVRWLADTAILINTGLDWARLEEQAQRLERIGPVRETILFLEKLEVALPPGLAEHWRGVALTDLEQTEGGYHARLPNPRERTRQLAWMYWRLSRQRSAGEMLRNIPDYMRQVHHFRAYSRRVSFVYHLARLSWEKRRNQPPFYPVGKEG